MRPPAPGPAAILVSGWLLIVIATGVIIARLYLRLKIQKRKLLVADLLMCGAWLCAVVVSCLNIVLAQKGVLESEVKVTMRGYRGSLEDLPLIFEVILRT
ncbi:hypothetical protein QQZ08_011928 [Neonectria magnoliae]|uniref:Uncharacterized protein n=1 Tax=Neonectria magnoliae TaxID=2732573 RepID=A0ABR1H6S7_9HYPO